MRKTGKVWKINRQNDIHQFPISRTDIAEGSHTPQNVRCHPARDPVRKRNVLHSNPSVCPHPVRKIVSVPAIGFVVLVVENSVAKTLFSFIYRVVRYPSHNIEGFRRCPATYWFRKHHGHNAVLCLSYFQVWYQRPSGWDSSPLASSVP